jgi:hypothetical protein
VSILKVGFSRPRKWFVPFSWLIRLFDGTPYSHVYIRFYSSKYDRWMVYQASHTYVNFYGMPSFEKEALVVREFDIEVDDETRASVIKFAIDNAGVPYNLKTVFGIAFVKIAALFGVVIDKNPLTGDGFFCSLLVGDIMVGKLGNKLPGDPNLWTPRVIYETLEKGL